MINNVTLVGRLAKDPDTKKTQSGVSYANITMAVERDYAGEGKEKETDFIDCRAWRGTAEFIGKYFKKGNWIGIEGEIQTSTYEGQDGVKRKAVYIQVRKANFVGAKENKNQTGETAPVEGYTPLTDEDVPF